MFIKMQTTLIQVKKETANRIKSLKDYGRQSYDDIINNKEKIIKSTSSSVKTLLSDGLFD